MSLVAESCLPRSPPRPRNKRRVILNVVAAAIVTALEIAMFMVGMRHAAAPVVVNAIAVRLVTLPAPAAPADAMPMIETTAPAPPPAKSVSQPPLQQPPSEAIPTIETSPTVIATPRPTPSPLPAPIATAPTVPSPKPVPRRAMRHARSSPVSPPREASPPAVPQAAVVAPAAPSLAGGGTMGARAIYKPMPEIPEELRDHPMTLVAMARFRVAGDGSATVELITSTANPLLNRALLGALQRWRFFPATNQGRPVASTIDLRIPVEIR